MIPVSLNLHKIWKQIYTMITKNIRYLLWNRGFWCSLNNTYPIFLTPCIRSTNHLCDSCDLTVTAPNDSKCWPIVTSSIQEPVASNCDVTVIDCSRVVALDAFSEQWCWGQWFKEFDQIVATGYHEKCKRHYFASLVCLNGKWFE